ncbi:hypothetical protein ACO0QE_000652 [Hanseniaspora vineae]
MLKRQFHTTTSKLSSSVQATSASLKYPSQKVSEYFSAKEDSATLRPPSFKSKYFRNQYKSPLKIHETFDFCNEYLHSKILANRTSETVAPGSVARDLYNPAVRYNFQFHNRIENNPQFIDYNLPVYRKLCLDHWQSSMDGKGQMLLMQRLESLKVIPDTLPTLAAPQCQLHVRFPFVNGVNRWIEPGMQLSTNATSYPPQFKIVNMIPSLSLGELSQKKYTLLIVNPDQPDVEKDSFKTTLHYALTDISFSDFNNNVLSEFNTKEGEPTSKVLAEYVPPVPEKNTGLQRFAVWLLEHKDNKELLPTGTETQTIFDSSNRLETNFDIRAFAEKHNLHAVGANVWRSAFDSSMESVRQQYGLPKARVFHKVRV